MKTTLINVLESGQTANRDCGHNTNRERQKFPGSRTKSRQLKNIISYRYALTLVPPALPEL